MNSVMPFEWIAAVRFLREGIIQTLLIITGVSVGVGVIVFMSALLNGLQANFLRRVLSSQAQVVLIPPQEVSHSLLREPGVNVIPIVQKRTQRLRSIDQWIKVRDQMRRMPEITVVSPMASGPAFVIRGDANKSISLIGVEPEDYFRIVTIPDYIVAGTPRLTSQDALIGTDLANDLGASIGDKLRVVTASGGSQTLSITGIFDLGNKGANQRNVIVALHTAQGLLNLVGGVSSIDLAVSDIYAAETIAQEIEASNNVQADSWIKTNAQFFSAVNSQTFANYAIRFFVGLSVALGIASVLVVSVVQRSKEIGILRAMGAGRARVMRVFLLQGGIVGLIGSFFGSALAYLILIGWQTIARNPDGTIMFPVSIGPDLVALAALLATATGVVAAIMPAVRAAKLDPVVAIRG
jgi:lipoprotein-releasing system permease protein